MNIQQNLAIDCNHTEFIDKIVWSELSNLFTEFPTFTSKQMRSINFSQLFNGFHISIRIDNTKATTELALPAKI